MRCKTALCGHGSAPSDEVLAAHIIEYCADRGDALKQMRDLLVPGGRLRLVVSKPPCCNPVIWLQWRHRAFAREEIHALVKDPGVEIESDYAFPAGPPSRTSRGLVARRI